MVPWFSPSLLFPAVPSTPSTPSSLDEYHPSSRLVIIIIIIKTGQSSIYMELLLTNLTSKIKTEILLKLKLKFS